MSLATRASLALALAAAGGFGLPGAPRWELLGLLAALGLGVGWVPARSSEAAKPSRFATSVELLSLAVIAGLLARTLGRVVIAMPSALWSMPVAAAALVVLGRRSTPQRRGRMLAVVGVAAVVVGAAVLGAGFEARGPQPRGRVYGSPVLGVHPRQAIAVQIDGFGPHDIVVDDYVDPPGGQGYDPQRFAKRLEAELHAIAERNYAAGPARARQAFARAKVETREALVPPADRELYESLIGLEVRSGTTGEGSRVEFVCPGQPRDPRGVTAQAAINRSCPRKYLIDGSTGLGLAERFPGHTQVIGRDRLRLAYALGWPSGDARRDRRLLALESGVWLVGLVLLAYWLARSRARQIEASRDGPDPRWAEAALITGAVAAMLLLALRDSVGEVSTGGGPTLLAIALILIPSETSTASRREPAALPFALLVALLAVSPLGGRGDALEVLAITRAQLSTLGLDWAIAGAIAGSLGVLVLTVGLGIAAGALVDRSRASTRPGNREGRHTRADRLALGVALALAVGLALRKPADDLPLLASAAALLVLAISRPRTRWQGLVLALATSLAAAAPLLEGEVDSPIASGLVALGAALCLALGLASWARGRLHGQTSRG